MKAKLSILLLTILLNTHLSFASDTQRVVNDNNGGATARITFKAEVVKLLYIETNVLELNVGKISAGQTKELGADYKAIFHLSGLAGSKFIITLINESYSNNGASLNGLNWGYRNSGVADYNQILSFPYISQLNENNGDGWIMVYPESITANENIESTTIYFEFKFNCSYYEL
jgi:hypothetical protein